MKSIDPSQLTSAGLSRSVAPLQVRPERRPKPARFVTQSHALGRPMANPFALIVAAALAITVYLLGSRLSH